MSRSIPSAVRAALLFAVALSAAAHDIPNDVTVHMFVRPAGSTLELLVRLPLGAVRDIEFPEIEGGYLDVAALAPQLPDFGKVWIADFVELREDGARLRAPTIRATRVSLPDASFASFDTAMAGFAAPPLANADQVVWNQVMLDVRLAYPIRSDAGHFSIRPGMQALASRVVTVVRYVPRAGALRAYEFVGDPGLVPLDPRWHQAAFRFVRLGFDHILSGADHLLFLVCLVIPLRRLRPLVLVVTAFTVAHSLTLLASALDLVPSALWFPPAIETLIAISIVYMALENIVGVNWRRRWWAAFAFGLVHGFGFSFALRETLQFAGGHLLTSLVAFNVGVECGQVLVLAVLVPAIAALFRYVVAPRMGTVILSAFVAHTAWHWTTDRASVLARYDLPLPQIAVTVAALAIPAIVLSWLLKRSRPAPVPPEISSPSKESASWSPEHSSR